MFGGQIQSGIIKMLLTGLGKQVGAKIFHAAAIDFDFDTVARSAISIIRGRANILGGLAIVENGYGNTAQVAAIHPDDFETTESQLLAQAASWMPRLPFLRADILLVDEIGKHISGKTTPNGNSGTVTLFNSCGRSDGAAAVIVTTEARAKELGLPIVAEIKGWGYFGNDPAHMGHGRPRIDRRSTKPQ